MALHICLYYTILFLFCQVGNTESAVPAKPRRKQTESNQVGIRKTPFVTTRTRCNHALSLVYVFLYVISSSLYQSDISTPSRVEFQLSGEWYFNSRESDNPTPTKSITTSASQGKPPLFADFARGCVRPGQLNHPFTPLFHTHLHYQFH
jgi:hypothetical protein